MFLYHEDHQLVTLKLLLRLCQLGFVTVGVSIENYKTQAIDMARGAEQVNVG